MSSSQSPNASQSQLATSTCSVSSRKRRTTRNEGKEKISIGEFRSSSSGPWMMIEKNSRSKGPSNDDDWWDTAVKGSSSPLVEDDDSECGEADKAGGEGVVVNDDDDDDGKKKKKKKNRKVREKKREGRIGANQVGQTKKTTFRNVGLENWERSREVWRAQTVQVRPPHPPPVRYDDIVHGLTQVARTYELPGRMTLSDIVNVFVDIWECEKDY